MSPKNVLSRRRCVVGHSVEATTEGGRWAGGTGGLSLTNRGRDETGRTLDSVTGG